MQATSHWDAEQGKLWYKYVKLYHNGENANVIIYDLFES